MDGFKNGKSISSKFKDKQLTSEDFHKFDKLFLEKNHIYKCDHFSKKTLLYMPNIRELKPPEKGEQLRIRTQQRFNLLLVLLILIENYEVVDEITIASYTFNKETFYTLIQMLENGKLKRLNLVLAPFFKIRQFKYYEELKNVCKKTNNVHLTFAHSHLKITVIKAGENYYQMEGSMNYSANQMAEQIVIENNKDVYDFDYNFLLNILAKRKNKALEYVC